MSNNCLPKQLLASAPVGCKRNVGGQKRRWNDVVYLVTSNSVTC